ncbi:hypothetical protein [Candidatus Regiella insecticola]|nr:hypothetical protein [Candidatus Regiella insecticola]
MKKIRTCLNSLFVILLALLTPAWASAICNATTWEMTFVGPIPVCKQQKIIEQQATSFHGENPSSSMQKHEEEFKAKMRKVWPWW